MASTNSYRTPTEEGGGDLTPPYSPAGRFGRLSYIAWVTIISIIGQVVMLIVSGGAAITLPANTGEAVVPEIGMAALIASVVVGVAILVFTILFSIRRCHDIDISGWWNLLIVIPLVNLVYGLFLVLKPGTDGPNRFGPVRDTAVWEKVVGFIGIALMVVAIIGMIAAIAIPAYMGLTEIPGQTGM